MPTVSPRRATVAGPLPIERRGVLIVDRLLQQVTRSSCTLHPGLPFWTDPVESVDRNEVGSHQKQGIKMNARYVRFAVAVAAAVATAFATPVLAQVAVAPPVQSINQADTQRNVDQQQRIESGLKSGQLSTGEAGRLERGEANVDRIEKNADRNGSVSASEQARITNAQDRESKAIYDQKHDAQTGNPNSASSRRMQADVQRNVAQQGRIAQGEKSGQLTTREAGSLERGQARTDRAQARVAANGNVSANEQNRIQSRENRQSARIYTKKHNSKVG
jgi:hypothetical protein